jgi:hypothetical protein
VTIARFSYRQVRLRNRERYSAYWVTWVRIPPSKIPMAPPSGAPAENVENAIALAGDGGKACARIPTLDRKYQMRLLSWPAMKKQLTEAGITAAPPIP